MSNQVRTPEGFKGASDSVQRLRTITDADSPFDMEPSTYLNADSTAGVININLPTARAGGTITVNFPAAAINNVTLNAQAGEEINGGALPLTFGVNGAVTLAAVRGATGVFGWAGV